MYDPLPYLEGLHDDGVLTDTEYADAKARLAAASTTTATDAALTTVDPTDTAPTASTEEEPTADAPADSTLASSQPCPNCGTAATVVTTASPAAIPATTVTGDEVPAGATIHHCSVCSAILETFEATVEEAWTTIEARFAADVAAAQDVAADPAPATTEGS